MEILRFDNFYELIEKLGKEKIMVIDDNHNRYIAIKWNDDVLMIRLEKENMYITSTWHVMRMKVYSFMIR